MRFLLGYIFSIRLAKSIVLKIGASILFLQISFAINFAYLSFPNLNKTVNRLNKFYHKHEKPYRIDKIAGGYQLVTKPEFEIWIRRLLGKSNKLILSAAALDTLAIIAYKQPIGRYDIEAIRGVDSSGVIKTLLSRNLIVIKGRGDGPGRPLLYSTTKLLSLIHI